MAFSRSLYLPLLKNISFLRTETLFSSLLYSQQSKQCITHVFVEGKEKGVEGGVKCDLQRLKDSLSS